MRELFPQIGNKKNSAIALKEIANSSKYQKIAVNKAYQAAAEMALAKYNFIPTTKLSEFNSGKKNLEAIVNSDSTNIEIRFIRFAIQNNVPAILLYKKNIPADKKFILEHLSFLKTQDSQLYSIILSYLLLEGHLNESERNSVNT